MYRNTLRSLIGASSALVIINLASPALAHLGSFRPADGYNISQYVGSVNWADVSYFNAGSYGANAGGGSGPTLIAADSGKWKVDGQIGGYFTSSAVRNSVVGSAPPYPGSIPSTAPSYPIYIVGEHFPGRGGDGCNLAVRNDTPAGTGMLNYDYSLDQYDFGGSNPASVTSGTVSTQFYFMPDPGTTPGQGTRARDKFIMSFRDSSANTGLQWGYADDNEVYWRTNSGPWNYTGVYATLGNWDGVKVSIDLTADTFGIDYYDVNTNTWSNMVAAGTALGAPMTDLTHLGWQLNDAVNTGIGGKNFFDDFSFTVPEPSTLVLGALGLAALRRRRA